MALQGVSKDSTLSYARTVPDQPLGAGSQSRRGTAMKAWTRWQDWLNLVLGTYLVASPWILGTGAMAGIELLAFILGALVLLVALWALTDPFNETPEWSNYALGTLAMSLPSVLGYWTATTLSWSTGIAGLTILAVSSYALVSFNCHRSRHVRAQCDRELVSHRSRPGDRWASDRSIQ